MTFMYFFFNRKTSASGQLRLRKEDPEVLPKLYVRESTEERSDTSRLHRSHPERIPRGYLQLGRGAREGAPPGRMAVIYGVCRTQ